MRLATPPAACLAPPGVFDAFGWCDSDWLDWRRPSDIVAIDEATPLDGSDPKRMVFVFHAPCAFLPRELARLHAFGLGLTDEEALAPWGIDDATDELYAHRVRPRDVMWLAADNLNALFWGLHDWAHFHSHGPFEQRAWTELQCDATALAWLWTSTARRWSWGARCGSDCATRRSGAVAFGRFASGQDARRDAAGGGGDAGDYGMRRMLEGGAKAPSALTERERG